MATTKMIRYDGSEAELYFMMVKNGPNFEKGQFKEMSIYLLATRYTKEQVLELKRLKFSRTKENNRHSDMVVETLLDWFEEHLDHPYPTNAERYGLQQSTGLARQQIIDWFVNQRKRHWRRPPQHTDRRHTSGNPRDPQKKKMILEQVDGPLNPTHPEKKIKISEQVDCPESIEGHAMHSSNATDVAPGVVFPQPIAPEAVLPQSSASSAFSPPSLECLLDDISSRVIAPNDLSQIIAPDDLSPEVIVPDAVLPPMIAPDALLYPLEDQNFAEFVEAIGGALDDVTHGAFTFNCFEQTADALDQDAMAHDHELTWDNFLGTFLWEV